MLDSLTSVMLVSEAWVNTENQFSQPLLIATILIGYDLPLGFQTQMTFPPETPRFLVRVRSSGRRRTMKRSRFTEEQIIGILKEH